MKASLYTKRFFRCPDCGNSEHEVEHLLKVRETTAGPWYCHDCGAGWHLRIGADDNIELTRAASRWEPRTVVLRLPPQDESILFTLETFHLSSPNEGPADESEAAQFLYEEHQCPMSWLNEVANMTIGEDEDPHGLFEFMSIEPRERKP